MTEHAHGTLPRIAIVTGSDSGIGRATALLLADEGFDVGLTVHDDDEGARRTADDVRQRGRRCAVAQFDASSPDAGDTVDRLADELGGIGVLVNVAGTGHSTLAADLDPAEWSSVLATDLTGPFLTSQRAARRMVAQGHGGRIVNVTSVHEHVPRVGAAAYCAAKAGLGMLTKVMALELAEHAITVNAVAPGEIATEMTGQDEADAYHVSRQGNPLGRPGHVNEVASVVAFLASPRAAYVTGASYSVDGGLMLMAAHGHDDLDDGWRRP